MSETDDPGPNQPTPPAADRVGLAKSRAKVAQGLFGAKSTSSPPEVRVGRYRVAERLGAGGMGVVYAAIDDELERRIALKVLTGSADTAGRTTKRLQREAKAMARVTHPNVATIYEVGNHDGEVFIAMEYVAGQTLRRWLHGAPDRNEALRVLEGAARGLAAAHAAGIVHRDFKPENVMVTAEGVAKILDFGVASSAGLPTQTDEATESDEHSLTSLTRTGGIAGTPAYMAPEQLAGQDVGPRSDQYAFFVVAYEVLCGQRPHAAKSVEQLKVLQSRRLTFRADRPSLPAHLQDALRRGLQVEPGSRFSDMEAVAELLASDPIARRRRRAAVAGAVVVAATGAFVAARATTSQQCEEGATRVAEAWAEGHRPAAASAFATIPLSHASGVWARAEPSLDDWATRWSDTHRKVCEATRVFETQSEETLTVRTECLERAWQRFDALGTALREPDGTTVANTTRAIALLAAPEPCATATDENAAALSLPAAQRNAVSETDAKIAAAQAMLDLGQWTAALAQGKAALEVAETLEHRPTLASALSTVARAQARLNEGPETLALLQRARTETLAAANMNAFARISVNLAGALEGSSVALQQAQTTLDLAEGAIIAAGDPAELRVDWLTANSRVAAESGDYDRADTLLVLAAQRLAEQPQPPQERVQRVNGRLAYLQFQRHDNADSLQQLKDTVASCEEALGITHPDCAVMHATIAGALFDTLQWKESLVEADLAVQRLEAALGPEHPWVVIALLNRGGALMRLLRLDDSQVALERALRIEQARSPHTGPGEASIRSSLAHLYEAQDRREDALAEFDRVHEILVDTGRTESMDVGHAHYNRARVLSTMRRLPEALAEVRLATAHYDRIGASEHRAAIASLAMEGIIVEKLGDIPAAVSAYERAIVRSAAHHGGPHPDTAAFHLMVGMTLAESGNQAKAKEHVETVLSILEQASGDNPVVQAQARFELAKLLWPSVPERPRALKLARQAMTGFAKLDRDSEAEAKRWIDEHGG